MNIFILEDDPTRKETFINLFVNKADFTIVSNVKDAVDTLTNNKFDWIFFDYDLITFPEHLETANILDDNTIIKPSDIKREKAIDVAKIIKDTINKDAMIILHTWSSGGAEQMQSVLPDQSKVFIEPFGSSDFMERVKRDVLKETNERTI
jgi:hypothetical protein